MGLASTGEPMTTKPSSPSPTRPVPKTWWVAITVIAMAIAGAISLNTFVNSGSDVTVFLRVGTYGQSRAYVEQAFPHPILTGDMGHDGQAFYAVAGTFPHLSDVSPFVDRPQYRERRILFPLLVSAFPHGAPMVWAMWGLNLLAIGACAIAFANLARSVGVTPWFGLIAGLNPALIESLNGSLADGLAFALALWGVVLWRRKLGWAVLLFALAALTRETALVAPLACIIIGDRRQRVALLAPFAAFAAWSVAVLLLIPDPAAAGTNAIAKATFALTAPFAGWLQTGLTEPGTELAVILVATSLFAAWALRERLPELSCWLLIDAFILVISVDEVITRPMNAGRVTPLALPAFALAVIVRLRHTPHRPSVDRGATSTGRRHSSRESRSSSTDTSNPLPNRNHAVTPRNKTPNPATATRGPATWAIPPWISDPIGSAAVSNKM